MKKLITQWQSLYTLKEIQDRTIDVYTTEYITHKLVPMWPDGWMKSNDILSNFMPKPKVKEPKKPANEVKTSKPPQSTVIVQPPLPVLDSMNDNVLMAQNAEKKKSHSHKDPLKLMKNANDKPPALPKTDKKHLQHPLSTSILSMPLTDGFNPKPVRLIIIYFEFTLNSSIEYYCNDFFPLTNTGCGQTVIVGCGAFEFEYSYKR